MADLKSEYKTYRDKADQALKRVEEIRREMSSKPTDQWPENAVESFDQAMAEFKENHQKAERLDKVLKLDKDLETGLKAYREPAGETADLRHKGEDHKEPERGGGKDIYGTPQGEFRRIPEELAADHKRAEKLYIRRGDPRGYVELEEKLKAKHGNAEQFALVTTDGPLGGYLVTPDFKREVDRALGTYAVMRGLCRVEQTSSNPMVIPTVQGGPDDRFPSGYRGAWKKEGYVTGGTAPPTQDQPKFGQSSIPVHWWAPDCVEISPITLQDASANVEAILAEVIAETKGISEDYAFIDGDGNGIPEGLLQAGLATVNSGAAGAITYDGLVNLWTALPAQYKGDARFLMNSNTYGAILKLKDSQNRPLIDVNTTPMQLWGKPIVLMEFMPDIAGSAKPIIFGSFRNYVIAERQDLRIQRLAERFAPNVGFLPTSRMGAQTVRGRAFRVQVIAA